MKGTIVTITGTASLSLHMAVPHEPLSYFIPKESVVQRVSTNGTRLCVHVNQ